MKKSDGKGFQYKNKNKSQPLLRTREIDSKYQTSHKLAKNDKVNKNNKNYQDRNKNQFT